MAQLILALDTSSGDRALELARLLMEQIQWFKVGLELFISEGPEIISKLKDLGPQIRIFLDLKIYDIPATAAAAVRAAARAGADMLTIHCEGGERMCRAAAEEAGRYGQKAPVIAGVTALTSFGPGEMPGISIPPAVFGLELAKMAYAWKLGAVVCSASEAEQIRIACPGLSLVCPGIRPAWSERNDQRRIMTPARAVGAGADFLVVGRPVTGADRPVEAAQAILEEMNTGN